MKDRLDTHVMQWCLTVGMFATGETSHVCLHYELLGEDLGNRLPERISLCRNFNCLIVNILHEKSYSTVVTALFFRLFAEKFDIYTVVISG